MIRASDRQMGRALPKAFPWEPAARLPHGRHGLAVTLIRAPRASANVEPADVSLLSGDAAPTR
jgi:hypothetical protein